MFHASGTIGVNPSFRDDGFSNSMHHASFPHAPCTPEFILIWWSYFLRWIVLPSAHVSPFYEMPPEREHLETAISGCHYLESGEPFVSQRGDRSGHLFDVGANGHGADRHSSDTVDSGGPTTRGEEV